MWRQLAVNIVVSAAVTAGGLAYYHERYTPRVQYIDYEAFVSEMQRQYQAGEIKLGELEGRLRDYALWLKQRPDNVLVFTSNSVLIGGEKIEWHNSKGQ